MSDYTVNDIDTLVEETGWDYTYRPYVKNPETGKYGDGPETVAHTEGWGEFSEYIDVQKSRWNDETKKREPLPEDEIEYVEFPGIGRIEMVESFGGEGEGDQYWFVFKITDADGNVRFFRRNGWYASFNGGYYDGPTEEVKPAEKTITVWVKA